MSNTSLILRPADELTATQAAMLAEMDREGNAGFDFQPLKLKFPTGGTTGAFTLSDGDFLKAPVEMIVAVAQRTRAYWPMVGGKKVLGKPATCSALDGSNGYFNPNAGDDMLQAALTAPVRHPALSEIDAEKAVGPWACAECPLAQWESAGGGSRAQACKAGRRLLVIVRGWAMPAVLNLPPTSIKAWDTFASGLRQRGQAYFSRWLTVEFDKANNGNNDYAVLRLKVAAPLTDPEAAEVMVIRAQYEALVRSMGIDLEDYDYATDAAAAPYTQEPADTPF